MKNINTKYKIIVLVPLMAMMGCKLHEHKNVINGIGSVCNQKILLLEDVDTGQERFYKHSNSNNACFYDYLQLGDTVTIKCGGFRYNRTESDYQRDMVLHSGDYGMSYNSDSIYARRERKEFNKIKKEMTIEQPTR